MGGTGWDEKTCSSEVARGKTVSMIFYINEKYHSTRLPHWSTHRVGRSPTRRGTKEEPNAREDEGKKKGGKRQDGNNMEEDNKG
jgi:hypothetical protein